MKARTAQSFHRRFFISSSSGKARGFTIVELLIVVVIIAIIASVTIVTYTGIQGRARDSKRASDSSSLMRAIMMYKEVNGQYPAACPLGDGAGCNVTNLSAYLTPTYMNAIPNDPDTTKSYNYVRGSAVSFGLYMLYESRAACKTGDVVNPGWWGAAVPIC